MSLRIRLSVTRLEERDTPSVPGPVDPSGAPVRPDPTVPAQTTPPPATPTVPPIDPHGSH
jgi:hypothetical protein